MMTVVLKLSGSNCDRRQEASCWLQDLGDKRRPKGLLRDQVERKTVSSIPAGVGHSGLGSVCVEALRQRPFLEVVSQGGAETWGAGAGRMVPENTSRVD